MATKTILITSGTTWVVPDDWTDAGSTIRAVGGGGGGASSVLMGSLGTRGGGGGGGGAYATVSELGLTAGATVFIQIGTAGVGGIAVSAPANGTAGTDTWLNISTNSAPLGSLQGVLAKAGNRGAAKVGGSGGASSSSVGNTTFSGGNGASVT